MRLAFDSELIVTTHFDPEMAMLADRHYSRRTVGARQFLYSGRKLVIRDAAGLIVFGWVWPELKYRMDGQDGFNCAIFRNESGRLGSEIILECERLAVEKWGPNRAYTYVDGRKIRNKGYRKHIPGYCFIKAGWDYVREPDGTPRLSKSGQHLLFKMLLSRGASVPETVLTSEQSVDVNAGEPRSEFPSEHGTDTVSSGVNESASITETV